jgi:hypothetical protein
MASQPQRQPLPFEPKGTVAKSPGKAAGKANSSSVKSPAAAKAAAPRSSSRSPKAASQSTTIPAVVSRRMVRRMALFSGIPTGLGIVTFIVSYWLLSRHIVDFPKVAVLLSTLGCFGLGVVGLSYGVLSASWEEDVEGSWLGASEFSVNLGRMTGAWRAAKKKPSNPG